MAINTTSYLLEKQLCLYSSKLTVTLLLLLAQLFVNKYVTAMRSHGNDSPKYNDNASKNSEGNPTSRGNKIYYNYFAFNRN